MRLINLKNLQNQKKQAKKEKKPLTLKNVDRLLEGMQKILHGFESKIFPTGKQSHGKDAQVCQLA